MLATRVTLSLRASPSAAIMLEPKGESNSTKGCIPCRKTKQDKVKGQTCTSANRVNNLDGKVRQPLGVEESTPAELLTEK